MAVIWPHGKRAAREAAITLAALGGTAPNYIPAGGRRFRRPADISDAPDEWRRAREARLANQLAQPDVLNKDGSVYPCTIFVARYSGAYEGGRFVCFPLKHDEIPEAATADDVTAMWFWLTDPVGDAVESPETRFVGRGDTPDEALADMIGRIEAARQRRST